MHHLVRQQPLHKYLVHLYKFKPQDEVLRYHLKMKYQKYDFNRG